jgi:hypothetical protein
MSTRPKYRLHKPGTPNWAAYREGGQFIMYTLEMLQHPAFATMSHVCHMFIKYLETQYLIDGGRYNGRLTARYTEVEQPPWRLHPQSLKRAIDEATERKLVVLTAPRLYRGAARSDAAMYRVAYLRTKDHSIQDERDGWERPTDDWKQYREPKPEAKKPPAKLRVVLS